MRPSPGMRIAAGIFLFGISLLGLVAQTNAPRYALVIGNSDYSGMPRLRNPANDARDVAVVLGKLGFAVTPLYNGSRRQMNQAIVAFRESLASDRTSEGFFYYAGHGVQAKGVNYLIPVGSDIRSEADLDDEAVSLQRVLGSIEEARNRVNVVILDACRDNPLPAASRSAARGLAVVASAPSESVVLFSTAQNQTAADGEGRNSPFAAALVKYLPEAGDISRTIKLVTAEVKRATGSAQTPFQYTSLDFDYQLNRGAVTAPSPTPAPAVATTLTVTRSYGTLVVSASTSGSLYLDGKAMGDLPAGAEARLDNVEAGDRSVELRYATGDKETKTVGVQKGQSSNVSFGWRKTQALPAQNAPAGLVTLPGGTFIMGSPASEKGRNDNEVQHKVGLSAFSIGRFEVSQAEWEAVMNMNPSHFQGNEHLPVENVSWYDCIVYCNRRSLLEGLTPCYSISSVADPGRWGAIPTGSNATWNAMNCSFSANGYRLPTEAEWEYACRAGTIEATGFGAALATAQANFNGDGQYGISTKGDSIRKTVSVGSYRANAWGLYDMHGNVGEWCWDVFSAYSSETQSDPKGPVAGGYRVNRGGNWHNSGQDLRSAVRSGDNPSYKYDYLGFRLVRRR
jgi:formylglycine-generating enzyme required for sulfatase activity